jgi:DNA repair exonuclease SbcCD ATPase subunit
MLTLVIMLGVAAAVASVGSLLLYRDHQETRQRLFRAVRGLELARQERDEACAQVEQLQGQVEEWRLQASPEILRTRQEAGALRRKLEDAERDLEEARRGRQESEEHARDLEEALEHAQGLCEQERARAKELAERERALAEKNGRLKAEAQGYAELLEAAQEAGATLTRQHNDLTRRHQALVRAAEEHRRALGTPGWYAESLKLVWQAAGEAGDADALRLPPLPEFLGQCIRHWQDLQGAGRRSGSVPIPPAGKNRHGTRSQAVAG